MMADPWLGIYQLISVLFVTVVLGLMVLLIATV